MQHLDFLFMAELDDVAIVELRLGGRDATSSARSLPAEVTWSACAWVSSTHASRKPNRSR
jgi:hypothetical protein